MVRTSKKIDPVAVLKIALRQVKTKSDYNRIVTANASSDIEAALATLTDVDRDRIAKICNDSPPPDLNAIASEITACGTYLELQAVKASHGEDVVKAAWKLVSPEERLRLKGICKTEQQQVEESSPVTEQPTAYQVEPQQQYKSKTLFSISNDLQRLSDLLDDCGDDAEQQELISQWFETLGDERDRKLDGYAALISEMTSRAELTAPHA